MVEMFGRHIFKMLRCTDILFDMPMPKAEIVMCVYFNGALSHFVHFHIGKGNILTELSLIFFFKD